MFCPFYPWKFSDSERLHNFLRLARQVKNKGRIVPSESLNPKPTGDGGDDNSYHSVSNYISKCL